jgi:Polyketide cyclase / dehydrase and lipid transport
VPEQKLHEIRTSGVIAAGPGAVFEFLADLRNHWRLTSRWVRVLDLTGPDHGPTGGWVELRGPMGLRRRLRTTVIERKRQRHITGVAVLQPRTRARVVWRLEANGSAQTTVRLEAMILSCGPLDRLLLAVGARRWLRRRFDGTLRQLAEHLENES